MTLSAMEDRFLIQIEHLADPVLQFFLLQDDVCDDKTLAGFCLDVVEKVRNHTEKQIGKKVRLGCLFICDWNGKSQKEIFHERQEIVSKSNSSLSEYFIDRLTMNDCGSFLPLKEDITHERLYEMIQYIKTKTIAFWVMGVPGIAIGMHAR